MFMYDMFACFQFYFEKSWFIMIASVLGAIMNIVLNYLFISPNWFNLGYVAAGYTTLICYILYAVGHFLCMRWVCRQNLNSAKVYDTRVLIGVSASFVAAGLLLSLTYEMPVLRFSLVGIVLLLLLIFHKRVIFYAKKFMSLRKSD